MSDKRSMHARHGRAERREGRVRSLWIAAAAVGLLAAAAAQAGAQPLALSELSQAKSKASLLSAGGLSGGRYLLGLDVKLAPGVLTYWRFPGDAGIPPQFSFAHSTNIASAQVDFPLPRRIEEAGATTFGYFGEVLFPIHVAPADPSRPIKLDLSFHYATCDTICVPAEAERVLDLAPGAPVGPERSAIEAWLARVPQALPANLKPKVRRLAGGSAPSWLVAFPRPSAKTDLFVEGPKDWYFDAKPVGPGVFEVSLAQGPEGAHLASIPARLTYVVGDQAYDARVALDDTQR